MAATCQKYRQRPIEMAECEFKDEKGYKEVKDEAGEIICRVIDYKGHGYTVFGNSMIDRMDRWQTSFPVYDGDICLVTYPKSGTHWVWEILRMLTHKSADYSDENKNNMMLEIGADSVTEPPETGCRKILNTHFCYDDVPPAILDNPRGKVIQVHRNPADIAVSFYHHLRNEVKGTALTYDWDDYITKVYSEPKFMPNGTWLDYTCDWISRCTKKENYLSLFYEDLKKNPRENILNIANFLGIEVDIDLIDEIAAKTSFDQMKKGKVKSEEEEIREFFSPGFSMYRKGVVNDWKNYFTKEQHEQFMKHLDTKIHDFPELARRYYRSYDD